MKQFTRIEPTVIQEIGQRFKRQVVIKNFRTDDGLKHEFTTISSEASQVAAVISLTPDNKVISVYQFRPNSERYVYELPGGVMELTDSSPEQAAIRELREETGYQPGSIEFLGTSRWNSSTNTLAHYYFATNCVKDSHGRDLDAEEEEQGAEVRLISIRDLVNSAKGSDMSDPRAVLLAYEKLIALEGENEKDN